VNVRLTLVSASPRRKDLLAKLNIPFDVAPVSAFERWFGDSAEDIAKKNAEAKVRSSELYGKAGRLLLGADTVVCVEDQTLGQPAGKESAERMLRLLSGREHTVVTGYCLTGFDSSGKPHKVINHAVASTVTFHDLSKKDVRRYIAGGEWRGKAGGYAIQGGAGRFVKLVEGDYDNVVGLPIEKIREDIGTHFSDCDFL